MGRPSTKVKTEVEAKEVKAVEVKDEVVTTPNFIEENIAKAKEVQNKKKIYSDEDTVLIASQFGGRLQIKNDEKPYDEYIFEGFGQVEPVRFGTLQKLRRRIDGHELFVKFAYVLDEEAVAQLGLTKFYADLPHPIELPSLLNRPLADIIKFIDNANEATKQAIREVLSDKLEKKEDINFYTVKVIAEKLQYELNMNL